MHRKNIAFLFILLSLLFQSLALILGKFAAIRIDHFTVGHVFMNGFYLASLACLGLQALVWPLALRSFPLFWSYLFMSGVYIVIPLSSHFIFDETVTRGNLVGSLLIVAGIAVISMNGKKAAS